MTLGDSQQQSIKHKYKPRWATTSCTRHLHNSTPKFDICLTLKLSYVRFPKWIALSTPARTNMLADAWLTCRHQANGWDKILLWRWDQWAPCSGKFFRVWLLIFTRVLPCSEQETQLARRWINDFCGNLHCFCAFSVPAVSLGPFSEFHANNANWKTGSKQTKRQKKDFLNFLQRLPRLLEDASPGAKFSYYLA